MKYKTGRKPPQFTPKMLKGARFMKDMLVALPAPPAVSADFVSAVMKQAPKSSYPWGMGGNDEWGDCEDCVVSHYLMSRSANVGTMIMPTTEETLALYSATTGFDPKNPATDQGSSLSEVCAYLGTTGFLGHKSLGHAPIVTDQMGPTQITRIKQGVQIFGGVNVGVNLPASAEPQFDAGVPWTVSGDLTIEGGHAIFAVGYDNNYVHFVSWGRLQRASWAWVLKFVEEAWVEVYPDFVTKRGVTPVGFDLAQVESYMAAIAG